MKCGHLVIVEFNEHARLVTPARYVVEGLPLGPRRAEVLQKIDDALARSRVEIYCNRDDDHPSTGKHWYKQEGSMFSIEWEVPEGAIWMAS